ncbi:MAG: TetR/AcrR family transcriptional regulator [Pseudomonadota bacterium]
MARTAKHSKQELRAMALAAARAVIAEEGSGNLNVRAVAARMDYSVGTIYNIFEGLEELVAAINAETLDALYDALSQAPVTGKPETDLHALLDRYLEFIAANRREWTMMFDERLPEAKAPPAWYLEKVAQVFTLLGRMLQPLFAQGEEEDLSRAVRLLWIAMHGIWTLDAGGKLFIVTNDPVEKVAHDMVDQFLAGLRGRRA